MLLAGGLFERFIWMVSYIWNGKESNLGPYDIANMIHDYLGKE